MYQTAATHVTMVSTPETTTMNQCHISLCLLKPFPSPAISHSHKNLHLVSLQRSWNYLQLESGLVWASVRTLICVKRDNSLQEGSSIGNGDRGLWAIKGEQQVRGWPHSHKPGNQQRGALRKGMSPQ